jgi:2-polyprenyl-3-methyl-5-hydroxy-6-metoxy-1,4-benzoquinol methylase
MIPLSKKLHCLERRAATNNWFFAMADVNTNHFRENQLYNKYINLRKAVDENTNRNIKKMNSDLIAYYSDRANEYDKVYLIPNEQQDLLEATKIFQRVFSSKTVLEIACGTGYWTQQIANSATSVLATDINESVIDIAKARNNFDNVVFELADMYSLATGTKFDALFGGFIWSHILLQDLDNFLGRLVSFLKPKSTIAFIDSKQVAGGVHDLKGIAKTDDHGNTYQLRDLEKGTTHMVLKNFPSREFLLQKLSKYSTAIDYFDLEHYWIIICHLDEKERY